MVKEVYFFTEMAQSYYPQDIAEKHGYGVLMFPNSHVDPQKAHDLYQMYLEEHQYASEVGFDGVMVNEHHNNPGNMNPSIDMIGSILAQITHRGKILLMGNILSIHDNPLRVAEEIAMMDIISGGRVVSGFVRGLGSESMANNSNPVHNRERYEEAHDLIKKIWTTPGPFRWEGKHYHYRVVNPWMLPLQKPHPPIWVPGGPSPETVRWAARHRYPYLALGTPIEDTKRMWRIYEDTAEEEGYVSTPDNFGYVMQVAVADSDEKAYEDGRNFYWQLGRIFPHQPLHWRMPPGYMTRAAWATMNQSTAPPVFDLSYEEAQEIDLIAVGSPDTVIEKIKSVLDSLNPAFLVLWAREGPMPHETAMRALELLGKEVIPAIKEYQPAERGWR